MQLFVTLVWHLGERKPGVTLSGSWGTTEHLVSPPLVHFLLRDLLIFFLFLPSFHPSFLGDMPLMALPYFSCIQCVVFLSVQLCE